MCFDVAMTGSDQICDAATSDNPSFTCPPQLQVGSCPSAGLIGCCIIATPNAEFTTFDAGCYYDTTMATAAQSACTGSNESWQTTAP